MRLHPHYLKHVIHGNRIEEKTASQLMQVVCSEGAPADLPQAERTEQTKCAGGFRRHRFRQTRHSTLGGLPLFKEFHVCTKTGAVAVALRRGLID